MTSKLEICNLALIEAKCDESLESLNEKTVSAQRCKRVYDICRKELLSKYDWGFCTKFVHLARVDIKSDGFKYVYKYPTEALKITNVFENKEDYKIKNFRTKMPNNTRVFFSNGTKLIGCDYEQAYAEYVYDEQETSNFSPLFVRLLYLEMALRLAKLCGADANSLTFIYNQIQLASLEAKEHSVNEDDNHLHIHDDYYIKVRG